MSAIGLVVALMLAAPVQSRTVRDTSFQATIGTGSLSGIVVDDEDRPVRRAVVTLTGDQLRPSRGAITDDEGRFTLTGLPAGRFTLTVARGAYVSSAYGAKRPGRPGTGIVLSAGQAVTDLSVRLWRGAVVAGVVRDERGRPAQNVEVAAVPAKRVSTPGLLTLSNPATRTNDRGEYRIFGLLPGTYLVAAKPSTSQTPSLALAKAEIDATFAALKRRGATAVGAQSLPGSTDPPGLPIPANPPFDYAPVYFPGTPEMAGATPIELAAGQEVLGLDIPLMRMTNAVVDGLLMRHDGSPAAGAEVQMEPAFRTGPFATERPDPISTTAGPDGRFRFAKVPPGQYTLVARANINPIPPPPRPGFVSPGGREPRLWASHEMTISGADVTGLALTLVPPMTMTGRVVFDGAIAPPENLSQVMISLFPPGMLTGGQSAPVRSIAFAFPIPVNKDGTVALPNVVPGTYEFYAAGAAIQDTDWWPRSAMLNGRDLLDGYVEITPDMNLDGLVVTFTDRRTELSGTLQTASGAPASDVFVIAYAADRQYWGPRTRRVQAVRPDADGRYAISDLPPGDYYLAALTDIDENEWQDPAFLEMLVSGSLRLTLGEGQTLRQDLRVGM
jgi:hypothetical protein